MEERVRVQEEFEKGVTKVLICTDLMTRGIDVPGAWAAAAGAGWARSVEEGDEKARRSGWRAHARTTGGTA
jgi:Lhr-like helicase